MGTYKLSETRKNTSVNSLIKLLVSKKISKEEKTAIKKLIIDKRKKNKILASQIVKCTTAKLAYKLLDNFGCGESVKMGNSKLTTYDPRDVLLVMGLIVKTAHEKKIKL